MGKHKYQTSPNERAAELCRAIKHAEQDGNDGLIIGLSDVRAELAESRALVERLPLTAEGVRVVPGMILWDPVSHEGFVGPHPVTVAGYVDGELYVRYTHELQPARISWMCYDTAEAAEAALAAAKEQDGR